MDEEPIGPVLLIGMVEGISAIADATVILLSGPVTPWHVIVAILVSLIEISVSSISHVIALDEIPCRVFDIILSVSCYSSFPCVPCDLLEFSEHIPLDVDGIHGALCFGPAHPDLSP